MTTTELLPITSNDAPCTTTAVRFVDADADQRRVVDHRADQAVVALPLEKVLIDDDLGPEAEALARSRLLRR